MPNADNANSRRSTETRLLAEQTRQLYGSLPSTLIVTTVVALLLVVTHWSLRPQLLLGGWLLAFVLLTVLRLALLLAWRGAARPVESSRGWYARLRALTLLAALIWGSSAWVLFSPESPGHQVLLMFIVAGLGAGAVVHLAVRWQCAWLYLVPTLLPFVARFWTLDAPLAHATAGLIASYLAAMMAMSLQLSRSAVEHIRARLDQVELAGQAQRQQQRYQSLVESMTAIVWEADPETLEFKYVSPESEKLLGYAPEQWTSRPGFWQDHIHPDDRDWVMRYCTRATAAQSKHSFDYRMIAADGRTVWLRDVVNVVVRDGRAETLVGVMIDINELKETQRNLEYVSGLQHALVNASRRLFEADEDTLNQVLSGTLEQIGRRCQVDRAYLIRFSPDLAHFTNTHEWVAPGIGAEMHNMQQVPSATIPVLLEELGHKKPVVVPDVAVLDDRWHQERALFAGQDIQSLVCLPIFFDDRLAGLIGFDSVAHKRDWSDEEVALLQVLGDLIGVAVERSDKQRQLHASETMRKHAEALARMGSWEWRVGAEQFHASDEWYKVTGCSPGPLTRSEVLAITPPDDRGPVEKALRNTVETGVPYNLDHRIIRPDNGEVRWVKVHAELVQSADGHATLSGFLQDITELKVAEKELFHRAHFDSLTGLPNRALALDRLGQSIKRARRNNAPAAVLFLDLDQFKKVNDTLGHDGGDRMLIGAADRLIGLLREQDVVARIGGDEFVVVLDGLARPADVVAAVSKVLDGFRRPFIVSDREFTLTASIGIALFPGDGDSAHDLMRNADTAMYHAKQNGRDAYQFFARSMNEAVERQLTLERALRGAIERDELFVLYQPMIRLDDRTCIGVEALLRWRHPELGNIAPDEFIGVAEQCGLINNLGEFVMRRAVAQAAEWRDRLAPDFCVAVNVSPREFRDPKLVETISSRLAQAGLAGDALEIEITEGVLLSGRKEVRQALDAIRRTGIGLVMDDFGTGYASLSYLRDHPFSRLKIDRSFVRNLDTDQRQRQLVVSALRLGEALGMKVVAEGVETEAQLAVLIEEGCPLAQGYLFSRPVEAERISELLSRQAS